MGLWSLICIFLTMGMIDITVLRNTQQTSHTMESHGVVLFSVTTVWPVDQLAREVPYH